ncbi:MAG: hypothetical protein JZU65_19645 [Chlorobium sp.]|nr:hypothetical protein [Chlorobium sp.]
MSFNVNPFNQIKNTRGHGLFMGNRGELKVEYGELVGLSRWKSQSWIYCSIDEKFKPKGEDIRKYTKLFFMDEFTALAAGHRPCWDCLREKYDKFIAAWLTGNPEHNFREDIPKQIDREIHKERKNSDRSKQTYPEKLVNLPDGVMVTLDVDSGESFCCIADSSASGSRMDMPLRSSAIRKKKFRC